jgi:3-oxoacyl-[acyl-carrier-protein] synthase II
VLFPVKQLPSPARVVITGAGVVSALGIGWRANAEGFRVGRVAFGPVTLFDVTRQRAKTAAEAPLPQMLPNTRLSPRQEKRLDRASRLLLLATHEAWTQARWESLARQSLAPPSDSWVGRDSVEPTLPLVLGTTSGGMRLGEEFYRQALARPGKRRGQPTRVIQYQPQCQALDLATAFGFSGPITIIANACASGANAIGHAFDLVRSGQAQRVLAGGYDALSHLVFAGFDSLQALSTTQCRPFDAARDGLGLGEGAAMLCLESLEHAEERGAEILGELTGYGAASDPHHLTQPDPEGDAAFEAMAAACDSARVAPSQIDYINAHGTGTPLNDAAEALAIRKLLGSANVPASSTKSSVGHLLGAAGAIEAVVCLMALREGWLPPTSTVREIDSSCDFPFVREPTRAEPRCVLSNSFGFGGANAALVLRRWA